MRVSLKVLHSRATFATVRLLAAVLLGWPSSALTSEKAPLTSYQVKAVFLFNFAKFVQWPEAAFSNASAPFVIGVLGKNPFGSALEETLRDQKTGSRAIALRRLGSPDECSQCHVMFISSGEEILLSNALRAAAGAPILTVTETGNFPANAGIINFAVVEGKVRFDINEAAAQSVSLKIDTRLLKLARVVETQRSLPE